MRAFEAATRAAPHLTMLRGVGTGHMADEHNARMFKWRKQLLGDSHLTNFDFRVAYALSERALRRTGCATVSQALLAQDVSGTPRGVQKSLRRLASRRHLQIEGNSKLGQVNRYRPIIRSSGGDELALGESAHGTNGCSHAPEPTFAPPYEPLFVGATNHGSEGVRTTVRTEDPYTDPENLS